ncbi:hypothetical protein MMC22_002807 [Lobaria immixta]|nr:hypothetical protein [Lobaria immixta]
MPPPVRGPGSPRSTGEPLLPTDMTDTLDIPSGFTFPPLDELTSTIANVSAYSAANKGDTGEGKTDQKDAPVHQEQATIEPPTMAPPQIPVCHLPTDNTQPEVVTPCDADDMLDHLGDKQPPSDNPLNSSSEDRIRALSSDMMSVIGEVRSVAERVEAVEQANRDRDSQLTQVLETVKSMREENTRLATQVQSLSQLIQRVTRVDSAIESENIRYEQSLKIAKDLESTAPVPADLEKLRTAMASSSAAHELKQSASKGAKSTEVGYLNIIE